MKIFPAIDLYHGQAVRLYKGNYQKMTVYSSDPVAVASDFQTAGAEMIHLVDLEGARDGGTPNYEMIRTIKSRTGLFAQVGGGIRSLDVIEKYRKAGIDRVILGTAAVTEEGFAERAVKKYGSMIAVGIDVRQGLVAVKGWTESSGIDAISFCEKMQKIGVETLICTDISKDGAMQGTNRELYRELSERFSVNIIASGGVSSLDDVSALRDMGLYGCIIGKAYYSGAIALEKAIEVAK